MEYIDPLIIVIYHPDVGLGVCRLVTLCPTNMVQHKIRLRITKNTEKTVDLDGGKLNEIQDVRQTPLS